MLISGDSALRIFESDLTQPSYNIDTMLKLFHCAVFAKDSRKIIIGGDSDSIYEIDIYNRKKRVCVCDLDGGIKSMAINEDQSLIAAGSTEGTLCIISYPELKVLQKYKKYNFSIVGVDFVNNVDIVYGDTAGHLLKCGPSAYPRDYSKCSAKNGHVTSLQCLKGGDLAVCSDKSLFIYDKYTEDVMAIYDIGASALVVAHPLKENEVIIGTEYGHIEHYDWQQEKVLMKTSIGKRITAMAYSANTNSVACAYFGGIDLIDLESQTTLHLKARGNNLVTMVIFQPEFIAIPDDAVFAFEHSTQVWASKAQISRSRTGNSMQISLQNIDGYDDDGDYSVNKLTFKRKLMDVVVNSSRMSPGKQCLSRSGIDIDNPANVDFSRSRSRSSLGGTENSREVSGILSFDKNGSPRMERRQIIEPVSIVAPGIASFPSQSAQVSSDQAHDENEDNNQTIETNTEIPASPEKMSQSSQHSKRQNSSVRFNLSPKTAEEVDPQAEEIKAPSDVIDLEPIPKNDDISYEGSIADSIWKKLDDINNRLDVLESRSFEGSQ